MKSFELKRGEGYVLEMMNALVRKFGLGNFIVQADVNIPLRNLDRTVRGYTDIRRAVSAGFNITWGDDYLKMVEAKASFGYCAGDGGEIVTWHEVVCRYSPESGITVT